MAANRAADMIEADHDTAEAAGGATELANLNLAHLRCNRWKRAAETVPVRPFLRMRAFIEAKGGRLKYDGLLEHFKIKPKKSVLTRDGEKATFEFHGTTKGISVLTEKNQVSSSNTHFFKCLK